VPRNVFRSMAPTAHACRECLKFLTYINEIVAKSRQPEPSVAPATRERTSRKTTSGVIRSLVFQLMSQPAGRAFCSGSGCAKRSQISCSRRSRVSTNAFRQRPKSLETRRVRSRSRRAYALKASPLDGTEGVSASARPAFSRQVKTRPRQCGGAFSSGLEAYRRCAQRRIGRATCEFES